MNTLATIHELCISFEQRILTRNRIRLCPFNERKWFNGAYSTIQRTLHTDYSPLSDDQKISCLEELFSHIFQLPLCNSGQKLDAMITQFSSKYRISIGHSQKLISIIIKYAYVANHIECIGVPKDVKEFVSNNICHLPIPVDTIVLDILRRDFPDNVFPISKSGYSRIQQTDGKLVTWSRLQDIESYRILQTEMGHIATSKQWTPMEFEMRSLWV